MKNNASDLVLHTFEPVYDENSRVLILGTMPSPKSRENGFYYGHPQNNFWRVMAAVYGIAPLQSISEKKSFLLENKKALWDVLSSCEITGASDNTIKNPVCNDFSGLLANSRIKHIFTTGTKATSLYLKYCYEKNLIKAEYLPSTSPANRKVSFETLVAAYDKVRRAAV